MLKPITTSIFLALSLPAHAESTPSPVDNCIFAGEVARSIMMNRQYGTPISEMLEIADGNDAFIAVILDAYSQTRYSAEVNRDRAAEEFSSEVTVICMVGLE